MPEFDQGGRVGALTCDPFQVSMYVLNIPAMRQDLMEFLEQPIQIAVAQIGLADQPAFEIQC